MVWACDRLARSTRHFLEVLDELNRLNLEFISFRENLDTGGPLGRAVVIERGRAGMRRAKLEGWHIGRRSIQVDRAAILHARAKGQSLTQIPKAHANSRALVCMVLKAAVDERSSQPTLQVAESARPVSAKWS